MPQYRNIADPSIIVPSPFDTFGPATVLLRQQATVEVNEDGSIKLDEEGNPTIVKEFPAAPPKVVAEDRTPWNPELWEQIPTDDELREQAARDLLESLDAEYFQGGELDIDLLESVAQRIALGLADDTEQQQAAWAFTTFETWQSEVFSRLEEAILSDGVLEFDGVPAVNLLPVFQPTLEVNPVIKPFTL